MSLQPDIEQAIAAVRAAHLSGTAFLVAPDLAATAWHVVVPRSAGGNDGSAVPAEILLTFPATRESVVASLIDGCPDHDWAVLQLPHPMSIAPLPLGRLRTQHRGRAWFAHGFPMFRGGEPFTVHGTVSNSNSLEGGVNSHQLFCQESAATVGVTFRGLSGAPCIVDGHVVGVLRAEVISLEPSMTDDMIGLREVPITGTLFACPVERIRARTFAPDVPDISLDASEEAFQAYFQAMSVVRRTAELPGVLDEPAVHEYPVARFKSTMTEAATFSEFVKLAKATATKPRIMLRGDPGAGKTTWLYALARHVLTSPPERSNDRRLLPLIVSARHLADAQGTTLDEVFTSAMRGAREFLFDVPLPDSFLLDWATRYEADWLFLIDGLDEVPMRLRDATCRMIGRIAAEHSVIVATRPAHLDRPFEEAFARVDLVPFTEPQQARLVAGSVPPAQVSDFALWCSQRLRGAQGNPLLLNLAARFYKDHMASEIRAAKCGPTELYAHFVASCVQDAWARGFADEIGPDVARVAEDVLEHLAVNTVDGTDELMVDSTTTTVSRAVESLLGYPAARSRRVAAGLLTALCERSGLLIREGAQLRWLHRTLCEFLASRALAATASTIDDREAALINLIAKDQDALALFLLATWAEQEDVTEVALRLVQSKKSPAHLAFIVNALASNVDLSNSVLREAYQRVRSRAYFEAIDGDRCRRVFSKSAPMDLMAKLLSLPALAPEADEFRGALLRLASSVQACRGVIWDLKKVATPRYLADRLDDQGLAIHVRYEIAEHLTRRSIPSVVRDDAIDWITRALQNGGIDEKLLGRAIGVLGETAGEQHLLALCKDDRVPLPAREQAVPLLNGASIDELLAGLQPDHDLLACVQTVQQAQAQSARLSAVDALALEHRWDQIAAAACAPESTPDVRSHAFERLLSADRLDELSLVVQNATAASVDDRVDWCRRMRSKFREASRLEDLLPALDSVIIDQAAPVWEEWARLQVNTLFSCGRHRGAIPYLNQLIQRYPERSEHYADRGTARWMSDEDDEAIVDFDEALRRDPSCTYSMLRKGCALWSLDRNEEALPCLLQGLKRNSSNGQLSQQDLWVLPTLGDTLVACRRWSEALTVLGKAVLEYPDDARSWAYLGYANQDLGRWREALVCLEKADQRGNGSSPIYRQHRRLECLMALGAYEKARSLVDELLAVKQSDEALSQLVQIALLCGDPQTARDALDKLHYDTEIGTIWEQYLAALVSSVEAGPAAFRAAIEAASQASAAEPDEPNRGIAWSNAALIQVGAGNLADACSMYKKVIASGDLEQLHRNALPELQTLVRLGCTGHIASEVFEWLRDEVAAVHPSLPRSDESEEAWQEFVADLIGPVAPLSANDSPAPSAVLEDAYPFPMYCRLRSIQGLDGQRRLAEKILERHGGVERAIVLFALEHESKLYGQCNFRRDMDDPARYKFCDWLNIIVHENLESLHLDYGVNVLLFLDPVLRVRVQNFVAFRGWQIDCSLVEKP